MEPDPELELTFRAVFTALVSAVAAPTITGHAAVALPSYAVAVISAIALLSVAW